MFVACSTEFHTGMLLRPGNEANSLRFVDLRLCLNLLNQTIQDVFLRNSSTNFLFLIPFHLGKFNLNTHKFVTSGNEAALGGQSKISHLTGQCQLYAVCYFPVCLILELDDKKHGKKWS